MVAAREVKLEGVVPIVPTPFTADEEIDFAGLERCLQFVAERGLAACCLPAYASEFYKLTDAERADVVRTAIQTVGNRVAIVAQANHPSCKVAGKLARQYEELGASLISFALPRIFPLSENDLLPYARTVCEATSLPVLIQDFNPGGPTVGADFARRLADQCPNFRYLKLEESLMGAKIRGILAAAGDRIGVLEGWGGMYMLDLVPAGICGLMPGLGVADILQAVWKLTRSGQSPRAMSIFDVVLPQIMYSLQHSEVFNWIEKRLLCARGVLGQASTYVRRATYVPDAPTLAHGDALNARVVELASRLASDPALAAAGH